MKMYLLLLLVITLEACFFFALERRKVRKYIAYVGPVKEPTPLLRGYAHERDKMFLFLVCIELILFAALRGYNVGADTESYLIGLRHVRDVDRCSFLEAIAPTQLLSFEVGYSILVRLCAYFRMSDTVFLTLVAVLIAIPTCRYIYRFSSNTYLSVLTYFAFGFFAYSLGVFRQMIAVSMILTVMPALEARRYIRYTLMVILASFFHTTALGALVGLIYAKINWKNVVFVIPALEVIVLIFGRRLIGLAVNVFPKYKAYLENAHGKQGDGIVLLLLFNVLFFFIYAVMRYRGELNERRNRILLSQLAMAVLVQCGATRLALFNRTVLYFSISLLILVPYLARALFDSLRRREGVERKLSCLVYPATFLALALLIANELRGIFPYNFFWQ